MRASFFKYAPAGGDSEIEIRGRGRRHGERRMVHGARPLKRGARGVRFAGKKDEKIEGADVRGRENRGAKEPMIRRGETPPSNATAD